MTFLLDTPLPPGPQSRAGALRAGWALVIAIVATAVVSVASASLAPRFEAAGQPAAASAVPVR